MRFVVRSALLFSVLVVAVVSLCGKARNDARRNSEHGATTEEEYVLFVG